MILDLIKCNQGNDIIVSHSFFPNLFMFFLMVQITRLFELLISYRFNWWVISMVYTSRCTDKHKSYESVGFSIWLTAYVYWWVLTIFVYVNDLQKMTTLTYFVITINRNGKSKVFWSFINLDQWFSLWGWCDDKANI